MLLFSNRQVLPILILGVAGFGILCVMDAIDHKILAQLQADGRLTATELAERVGLSVSPCLRRVRALEEAGVIKDYRARVEPKALGLNFSALVFVTLHQTDRSMVEQFEAAVLGVRYITQAQRLFGHQDYLLNCTAKDLDAFQRLYDDVLTALPGVLRLTSTMVMKNLIVDRALPLLD